MGQEISNVYQTRKGLDKLNIWIMFIFAMIFWVATVGVFLADITKPSPLTTLFPFIGIPMATYFTIMFWILIKKYKAEYGTDEQESIDSVC